MKHPWARASLLALAFVALAFSGCAGKAKEPASNAPANFDNLGLEATATTGIIRGIVVDDAIRPLAHVEVNTTLPDGTQRNVTSAADGAYGFDGLPPGTYFIKAHKAGFLPAQASADVVAGIKEPPIVKILLKADPASLPYVQLYLYQAFIACSFTAPVVSFAACGLAADQTNNAFLTNVYADKPPQWIQTEAVWESTQALGNELSLSITVLGPPQVGVNDTAGPSPIHITVNQTDALRYNFTSPSEPITIRLFSTQLSGTDVIPEDQAQAVWKSSGYGAFNATGANPVIDMAAGSDPTGLLVNPFNNPDCVKYPVLFNSCLRAGGVGMALQQRVDVYTHIFYGYTPPADWTFAGTGETPAPPA